MEALTLNNYYHIFNHANGNENLFKDPENYRYFLQQYEKHLSPVVDTLAYCLMPNHFHLVVKTKLVSDLPGFQNLEGLDNQLISNKLSQQFSNFFNSYTKAFNKKYSRMGSLFIKNFKRKPILSDNHLITAILYVHNNPVHHGFTQQMTDWQWSSVDALFSDESGLVDKEALIRLFGSKISYKEMHLSAEKEKLKQLSNQYEL